MTKTANRVGIFNHYASDMIRNKGGRHYWLAKYLIRMGREVTIFCASTMHNSGGSIGTGDRPYIELVQEGIRFVVISAPQYEGNGKQRVWNMYSFFRSLLRIAPAFPHPDVIFASSVHPLTLLAGLRTAKKLGIPCICEVRDLWPESLVAYGLLKRGQLITRLLYRGERYLYKKADMLLFTMEGGKDYIVGRGWDTRAGGPVDLAKVYHINNGVDLEAFDENIGLYPTEDADLDDGRWFNVVYTGSIRLVNKVDKLLDVADLLRGTDIRFLVWGSGDQLETLQKRIEAEKIENVVLKGRVAKQYIPGIVSRSDLNIIIGEYNPIYEYGLSANKVFEYLAAGRPVLSTLNSKYSIIERFGAGEELKDSSIESIAAAVLRFRAMSESKRESYGANARSAAEQYSFEKHAERLAELLDRCIAAKRRRNPRHGDRT